MLMAYEDRGKFKIEDVPAGPTRVPTHPIESHSKALEILEWAESERDDDIHPRSRDGGDTLEAGRGR
jgi:hypothetical protein